MTDKEWETFFTLIDKICRMPGAFADKRDIVEEAAENNENGSMVLEEFISWFDA